MAAKLFLVHLRKPWANSDGREDPFWERGSFGITGCHHANLLYPGRAEELTGSRLAFAQPGSDGTKLVYVTPRIAVRRYRKRGYRDLLEARWRPRAMPLAFEAAPILIDRKGRTDFPLIRAMLRGAGGATPMVKFAGRFRTRCEPLPEDVGEQLLGVYRRRRRYLGARGLATTFVDALPAKTAVSYDRSRRYRLLQKRAGWGGCTRRPPSCSRLP